MRDVGVGHPILVSLGAVATALLLLSESPPRLMAFSVLFVSLIMFSISGGAYLLVYMVLYVLCVSIRCRQNHARIGEACMHACMHFT